MAGRILCGNGVGSIHAILCRVSGDRADRRRAGGAVAAAPCAASGCLAGSAGGGGTAVCAVGAVCRAQAGVLRLAKNRCRFGQTPGIGRIPGAPPLGIHGWSLGRAADAVVADRTVGRNSAGLGALADVTPERTIQSAFAHASRRRRSKWSNCILPGHPLSPDRPCHRSPARLAGQPDLPLLPRSR